MGEGGVLSEEFPEVFLSFLPPARSGSRGISAFRPMGGIEEEELQCSARRIISHLDAALSDEFSVLI